MSEFIKTFNKVGICEVNVDVVCKKWNKYSFISVWNDEYTFRTSRTKYKDCVKCRISKEQADEIIKRKKLVHIRSSIYSGVSVWVKRTGVK